MKIGLIDVDSHHYPNLALMKLSAWHRSRGDTVEWWWGWGQYDRVYMSKVFDETYTPDIPEPVHYRERSGAAGKIVTPNGTVLSCDLDVEPETATGIGYISHWSTCPQAGRLRKREAKP